MNGKRIDSECDEGEMFAGVEGEVCISGIKATKRDPMRFTIHVEKKVVGTLSIDQVEKLGLRVGQVYDRVVAGEIETALGYDKARKAAMGVITRRMIGSDELRQRLRGKGHVEGAVEKVIDWLTEKGYLDDLSYARAVVRGQTTRKPAGRRLLEQKLYIKKLPRGIIQQVLDEAEEANDPTEEARKLAKKLNCSGSYTRLEPRKRKQRLYAALARRGFSPDQISRAMEGLCFEGEDDEFGGY